MFNISQDRETIVQLHHKLGGVYSKNVGELFNLFHEFDRYPRSYHSSDHIIDLAEKILKGGHKLSEERVLLLLAVYHDYVYDPRSKTNEEDSAEIFKSHVSKGLVDATLEEKDIICRAILDTKTHNNFGSAISRIFCEYDLSGFAESEDTILKNEKKIRKEYAWVDWNEYKKGKLDFLEKYEVLPIIAESPELSKGINFLKKYIITETPPTNIAVYAGSFNPFHVGHKNILEKAEKIFEKVIVAQGVNPSKEGYIKTQDVVDIFQKEIAEDGHWLDYFKYRQFDIYTTSLVEYFQSKPYVPTLIRGLRSSYDLQAEIVQTRWLQALDPEIKIVNIVCDKDFDHISSSGIREVQNFPDLKHLADEYTVG